MHPSSTLPNLIDKAKITSTMSATETLSESELNEISSFAIQLAKDAGQMLLDAVEARSGGQKHVEKESAVDLVTQTDEGEWCVDRDVPSQWGFIKGFGIVPSICVDIYIEAKPRL